jgi:putative FmdB family regulatory protein
VPTYSYRCTQCDNAFDIVQSFTDDSLTVCPVCQGTLRKVFSPVGVTFNGSGFYRTDSRSKGTSGSGSSGGDKGSSSASSDKGSGGASGSSSSGASSSGSGSSSSGGSSSGSGSSTSTSGSSGSGSSSSS